MSAMDLRNSVGARLIIVGVLTFLLLIPSIMIRSLISERKERRDSVADDISHNWGARQILIGPVLNIPFKYRVYDDHKNIVDLIKYAHFLPGRLDIDGVIDPEVRNRGIYDAVVYKCSLDVSAVFGTPQFDEMKIDKGNILFEDASISFGISDMKGVRDPILFDWQGNRNIEADPGVPSNDLFTSGISVPVKITPDTSEYSFRTNLKLNGSFGLFFSPIGKETNVRLASNWPNPSFTGDYLPIDRQLGRDGFVAEWSVPHVSRGFPQKWLESRYDLNESLFGVSLLLSVDQYQKTMRTVKYAIMFIALTFLTFFIIDILSGQPIHPIQYLLIGLALMVFYTLLLSLSEYIAFRYAYLIASVAIVAMITFYSTSFLPGKIRSLIVAIVLIVLYGYLYIVLQLQDYALLMGSLILFLALALVMYLTRKLEWFKVLNYSKTDNRDSAR